MFEITPYEMEWSDEHKKTLASMTSALFVCLERERERGGGGGGGGHNAYTTTRQKRGRRRKTNMSMFGGSTALKFVNCHLPLSQVSDTNY